MEFLLANHPLDCPICDQGGECDLQVKTFTTCSYIIVCVQHEFYKCVFLFKGPVNAVWQ